ncbi:hypothetical protein F7725_020003 [Dissostichus mawsoni]|uniref:BZIP domain-containing protein n=1 Tax=Dissostichus mawsoni TaxID=36200 RepID=A0A7J5YLB9_DISMA|nr:hypothetical protein F7725_020003 [Dissostichus mawsoni]
MMLQHPGLSLADISYSALVPCLSPPGSLTLDDFTNFSPMVKEELRLAIQSKRLSNGLNADFKPQEQERRRRRRERNKAQIEELKTQKQQLVYMLNLHRPTCIVRAQNGQTPEDERNLFIQHIKESTLQFHNIVSSTTTSTSTSTSLSTISPLDGGLLSLDSIHCH